MINGLLLRFFAACPGGDFFGLPTWHKYLPGTPEIDTSTGTPIQVCTPQLTHLSDIWLVVAAILEMLLRIAAIAALAFIVYGGVQYVMSQGEPDRTQKAKSTIINALVGLVIAVAAATLVTYVAGKF